MKIVKNFVLREIVGETVLVPVKDTSKHFNGLITINDVGKFIWNNLEGCDTPEQLLDKILDTYEVDKNTAYEDMMKFLKGLIELEIVEM